MRMTGRSSQRSRWAGAIMFALAIVGMHCSLVVESSSSQCNTTQDCTNRGAAFANSTCNAGHFCVTTGESGGECTTNQDCVDQHPDEAYTCRKSDKKCINLTSPECPAYTADKADLANDDAIYIGTILDRSGTAGPIGQAMEAAFNLARQEFRDAAAGLPPASSGGRRPLVLVNCDENAAAPAKSDPVKAATHLVDDLHVPVIIGGFYSSTTINVAQKVTIPKNVLLLTPASTSPLVTGLPSADPRLVWRMVPNDVIQGQVVPAVTSNMEATLKAEIGLQPSDKIKVAMVHRGDAAGSAIAAEVIKNLVFNGASATASANSLYFQEYNYGDPLADAAGSEAKYSQFAADMSSTFHPHIVITAGSTAEVVTKIMKPVEANWSDNTCGSKCYRPRYLLANSNFQTPDVLKLVGSDSAFRHRVLGHVAQTEGANLNTLRVHYKSVTNVPFVPLVPFAYDAIYLTAYGIVGAGNVPLTGPAIAEGFKKLLPPAPSLEVGLNNIPSALSTLTNNRTLDFNGASGPLDFDPTTGDAPCDVQVWCINHDSTDFVNSGYYYSSKDGGMRGSIMPSNCP